jgi:hypothetical protein
MWVEALAAGGRRYSWAVVNMAAPFLLSAALANTQSVAVPPPAAALRALWQAPALSALVGAKGAPASSSMTPSPGVWAPVSISASSDLDLKAQAASMALGGETVTVTGGVGAASRRAEG